MKLPPMHPATRLIIVRKRCLRPAKFQTFWPSARKPWSNNRAAIALDGSSEESRLARKYPNTPIGAESEHFLAARRIRKWR